MKYPVPALSRGAATAAPDGPESHLRAALRFDPEVIVDCLYKSLPGTEISFCGFYRPVTEQELNLFEFPSCRMAESCTRSAQIMRS
jgi:hypothetical protein